MSKCILLAEEYQEVTVFFQVVLVVIAPSLKVSNSVCLFVKLFLLLRVPEQVFFQNIEVTVAMLLAVF